MGEDLSTGMKIAVIVIMLCSIVAIVFSFLCITKNIANVATDEFQSGINGIKEIYWTDYDLKTVSGNQVQAYLKQCFDKHLAAVVRTTPAKTAMPGGVNYGISLSAYQTAYTVGSGSTLYVYPNEPTVTDNYAEVANDTNNVVYYDTKASCYRANVYRKPGTTETVYRTDMKSSYNKQSTVYISPSHYYNAYLIKDATNMIVGVFFDQRED